VRARRETDEHDARVRVPERRNRAAPIDLVTIGGLSLLGDASAVRAQLRTAFARNDAPLDVY
jgi:hypothetical protein